MSHQRKFLELGSIIYHPQIVPFTVYEKDTKLSLHIVKDGRPNLTGSLVENTIRVSDDLPWS